MIIRAFDPAETADVDGLLQAAFGQPDEAELVGALRADGHIALELVADHKKKVVGYVALSRMQAPSGWLAMGPVCAAKKMRNQGIASALCQMALQYANAPVVVLGEPKFYTHAGFDFKRTARLTSTFPIEYTGLYAPDIDAQQPAEELVYTAPFMG